MKFQVTLGAVVLMSGPFAAAIGQDPQQNWTNFVRIGAYGLRADNADAIVRNAQETHVYGIEVDNDIPGRYESFLDPSPKLKAIQELAEKAHRANNKAFVYIAGTECITANADKAAHSLMKDHPDWVQRKITGEPAVFTSGAAFSGSGPAMKMCGSVPTRKSGAKHTWNACGKLPPRELTASMSIFPTG